MIDADAFRRDLSGLLRDCAADRRRSLLGRAACGEDLKIIALFDRLALEAEYLPADVIAACQDTVGRGPLIARIRDHRDELLLPVGVLVWPRDAADLVRWMATHLAAMPPSEPVATEEERAPPEAPSGPAAGIVPLARLDVPPPAPGGTRAWVRDLSAGLAIVAPVLALWHGNLAFEQRRDQAILQARSAIPATVDSDAPADGRGGSSVSTLVVTFRPTPEAAPCRVTMHSSVTASLARGQSLMVVPRSSACETPLLPAQVGDPSRTLGLALALLIGGLVSLKVWGRLDERPVRPAALPAWS